MAKVNKQLKTAGVRVLCHRDILHMTSDTKAYNIESWAKHARDSMKAGPGVRDSMGLAYERLHESWAQHSRHSMKAGPSMRETP